MKHPFKIEYVNERYYIVNKNTGELLSGKMPSKKRAKKALLKLIKQNKMKLLFESNPSVEEIQILMNKNNGLRLKPKESKRCYYEALLVARTYKTRGELFTKNKSLYAFAYHRGILDEICKHMVPSRKKNKFVYGVLDYTKILGEAFMCKNLIEFRYTYASAYNAGLRNKINFIEFFENKDDAKYLQNLIIGLANKQQEQFVDKGSK